MEFPWESGKCISESGINLIVWRGSDPTIDKDWKLRASKPTPDLRISGERLKTLDIDDVGRYLGYWGMGNGYMSATREVVREKVRAVIAVLFRSRRESNPRPQTP